MNIDESELTVSMPSDMGVRVELNLSDTELTVDSSRFMKITDSEYVSRDYDQAEAKLNLTLNATDSSVSIR